MDAYQSKYTVLTIEGSLETNEMLSDISLVILMSMVMNNKKVKIKMLNDVQEVP